jgi:hypothetical protein
MISKVIKTVIFELFPGHEELTDDSLRSIATADVFLKGGTGERCPGEMCHQLAAFMYYISA